ncbi:MAG TPA: hypothetical protein VMT51_11565 [Dongiaceae bacterium]|nr:hypothetical protein [Dongiaceae bacterium]
MTNTLAILLSVFLLADADIPRAMNLRSPEPAAQPRFSGGEVPLFNPLDHNEGQNPAPRPRKATLQDTSKLELIRYVSGEFAKAALSLPAGKEGFLLYVGKPVNTEILQRAVATHGAAIHAGDQVQITKLEFHEHTIVVDVNGGGKGKRRWMDHVQIGMGGAPTMRSTTEKEEVGPPGVQPGAGTTIYLEFNKTIPDLTPEDLKQLLGPFMDFAKQRSASVQWIDTLQPEMKKAIQERTAKVGMDREMVVAAIGKPGHKVRERDATGTEIEDWIYGTPPDKTMFVRFTGEKVTSIKQFPQ